MIIKYYGFVTNVFLKLSTLQELRRVGALCESELTTFSLIRDSTDSNDDFMI